MPVVVARATLHPLMFRWLLALVLITAWWWTGACAMSHELARTAAFVAGSFESGPGDGGDYPDHEQVIRGIATAPPDSGRAKWQPAVLGGSLPIAATWSFETVRLTREVSRCPASRRVLPERARAPPLG